MSADMVAERGHLSSAKLLTAIEVSNKGGVDTNPLVHSNICIYHIYI